MHTGILECQQLDVPVTCETRKIQRFLIHPASEVMRFRVVREPANDLRQFSGSGLQFALKLRVIGSRTELLVNGAEESCRHLDKIRAAKSVIERHDLPDMTPDGLKILRIPELRISTVEGRGEQACTG
jgi:hypothetical protein